jgi:ABC-type sugar transport system permease subunit
MTTTNVSVDRTELQGSPGHDSQTPLVLYVAAIWHLIVAGGLFWLSIVIFQLPDFGGLGRPVQYFVATVPGLIAIYAIVGAALLIARQAAGRYASMALLYTGLLLSIVALMTIWGVWDGFEFIVDGVMSYPWIPLGFVVAYAANWLGFRFPEDSAPQRLMQNIAMGLASITLIILLWFSNLLNGIMAALDTYTMFEGGLGSTGVQAWAATVAIVIFGVLAYQMLNLDQFFGETPFEREAWQGWLMLSPNVLGFVIFFAGPLLLSFYLSFTNDTIGNIPEVILFQNYAELIALELQPIGDAEFAQDVLSFGYQPLVRNLFGTGYVLGARDPLFWRSLGNTLAFCAMLVPLSTIPAILLAIVLNSSLPGMKFYRAIYFLPSVAAVVGTALIWRWLYDPTIGFINHALSSLLPGVEVDWLSDPSVVLFSIVLLASWQLVGFNTVLFLAGLQGIPNVLYEASKIDGANGLNRFRFVTLPLLAPTTFFVVITTVVQGLQVFNEPYALFPSRPIPTNATTSVYYMYTQGFQEAQFGYASAVAWVLFAVIFAVTLIQFRIQRSEAY